MADIASWYITGLPSEIVDIVEKDVKKFDEHVDDSLLIGDVNIPSKEIVKMRGFLHHIGLQDGFGIMCRKLIEKIFVMI